MPADWLQRQWRTRGAASLALRPLAWLVAGAVALKRLAYRRGWRDAYHPGIPVIVVGNLYVGGTGKTPFTLALIEALRARGWRPGVVSRGYGARIGAQPRVGNAPLDPRQVGDEPALIAQRGGVPVAVHPRRAAAARALRAFAPEVDLIIADDGLQHLALARDLEIVVQDARGIGNGLLLPAGPLREPASRLARVDAVVTNVGSAPLPPPAVSGARPYTTAMRLDIDGYTRLADGARAAPGALPPGRIAAVAGIGQPQRFFDTLRAAGLTLDETRALPDHYDYGRSPFADLDADWILVTDKDAVKCRGIDDERLWSVGVAARLSDPHFFDRLEARLHGRPTAQHPGLPD